MDLFGRVVTSVRIRIDRLEQVKRVCLVSGEQAHSGGLCLVGLAKLLAKPSAAALFVSLPLR